MFLSNILFSVVGLVIPALKTHMILQKTIHILKPKPDDPIDSYQQQKRLSNDDIFALQNLCNYWICLGILAAVERILNPLLAWLPFYDLFQILIVTWMSLFGGSELVYRGILGPFLSRFDSVYRRFKSLASLGGIAQQKMKIGDKLNKFGQSLVQEHDQYDS